MNKIVIGKPYLEIDSNFVFFYSNCHFSDIDKDYLFYYKTPIKNKNMICIDTVDCFISGLLPFAMRNGYDIVTDYYITDSFLWNLNNHFVNVLAEAIPSHKKISINGQPLKCKMHDGFGGASLSCGVDSFYSIYKHYNKHDNPSLDIKYLCFFNAGASGVGQEGYDIFIKRAAIFEEVANKLGLEFVTVETNINDLYKNANHEKTHAYRTLGCVLFVKNMISTYYFSSSIKYSRFGFDDFDTCYHDLLTTAVYSDSYTKFMLEGAQASRMEKLSEIVDFPITYDYLNVCIKDVTNCSVCGKCMRTMLELFLLDKLDLYKNVFDVNHFYKHFKDYKLYILFNKNGIDIDDIYVEFKKRKLFTFADRIRYFSYRYKVGIIIIRIYSAIKRFRLVFTRKTISK